MTENRKLREEYYHAYDRVRSQSQHRKDAKAIREARPDVKELSNKAKRLSAHKYRERKRAANAVNNAVRDGRLSKLPCFICGSLAVQGHHPDYSRELDVVWLCTKHHAEIHREHDHEVDKRTLTDTPKGSRWDSE